MRINNIEVDFKITRPADAEKLETALAKLQKTENKVEADKKSGKLTLSKYLTATINMFSDFFVGLTGENILDGIDDYEEAQRIYFDFIDAVKRQQEIFKRPYSRLQIDSEVTDE